MGGGFQLPIGGGTLSGEQPPAIKRGAERVSSIAHADASKKLDIDEDWDQTGTSRK